MGRWLRAVWLKARSLPTAGVGCEQCVLRRKILGLGFGGSCTPYPTHYSKVLLRLRFQLVLTMVWAGVRFLEFWGNTVDCLLWGLGGKNIFPMQLVGACHPRHVSIRFDCCFSWVGIWSVGKPHEKTLKIALHGKPKIRNRKSDFA